MEVDDKKVEKETYYIYDFFKNHPGVLASCGSIVMALVAVILNAIVFLFQYIKLKKWNIDILEFGITIEGGFIYYLAFFLLYEIIGSILFNSLSKCFQIYIVNSAILKHYEFQEKYNESSVEGFTIKNIKEAVQNHGKYMIIKAAVLLGLFLVVMILQYPLIGNGGNFLLALLGYLMGIPLCLIASLCMAKSEVKEFSKRNIKKKLDEILNSTPEERGLKYIKSLMRCHEKFYELTQRKQSVRQHFSDSDIRSNLILFFAEFVAIVGLSFIFLIGPLGKQSDFWLYRDNQKDYVVAYGSNSEYILIEATIENSRITIDLEKQRILTSDDICLQQLEFEDVIYKRGDK